MYISSTPSAIDLRQRVRSGTYYFGNKIYPRTKVTSALLSAYNDPTLIIQEEKQFISKLLLRAGKNLFTDKEIKNLSMKLPYVFRQKELSIRADGQKIITDKNDNEVDVFSSPRFLFSEDLLPVKLSEKEDAIFNLYKEWVKEFTLSSSSDSAELQLNLNKFDCQFKNHGIKLHYNEDTTHEEVAAIYSTFELLPKAVLKILRNGLSGGIHLSLPEFKGLGQYSGEVKEMHLGKAKHFSTRGYLELILHEVGHACEDRFVNDKKFIELYNRAKLNMYKLPAIDENSKLRQNYISGNISEFFAETFMHYILQGNIIRNSFIKFPGVTCDNGLYREVYEYFKEKVFENYEYANIFDKITKINLSDEYSYPDGVYSLLSSQALKSRMYRSSIL